VGTPGALGNAFPPGIFATLRELARDATIDVELGN
jgi:hypothetical protein